MIGSSFLEIFHPNEMHEKKCKDGDIRLVLKNPDDSFQKMLNNWRVKFEFEWDYLQSIPKFSVEVEKDINFCREELKFLSLDTGKQLTLIYRLVLLNICSPRIDERIDQLIDKIFEYFEKRDKLLVKLAHIRSKLNNT